MSLPVKEKLSDNSWSNCQVLRREVLVIVLRKSNPHYHSVASFSYDGVLYLCGIKFFLRLNNTLLGPLFWRKTMRGVTFWSSLPLTLEMKRVWLTLCQKERWCCKYQGKNKLRLLKYSSTSDGDGSRGGNNKAWVIGNTRALKGSNINGGLHFLHGH